MLAYDIINIFASGPSIEDQNFDNELLNHASIFVNGSISLLDKYAFTNIVGYVITDARFIDHSLSIILRYYSGQPWFVTLPVLQNLIKQAPDLVEQYHSNIYLIYAVDRPIIEHKPSVIDKLFGQTRHFKISKKGIASISSDSVVLDTTHQPIIGVSFDITQGFVEAGTVAFVATQLAYSMRATEIHLFGIDLINTNQPRFYETQNDKAPIMLEKAVANRIVPSFDMLASEYEKRGCSVYNHSSLSAPLFKRIIFIT